IGQRPDLWRSDVTNYANVGYTGIYPGIDVAYRGAKGRLEYDFAIAPGSDPNSIRLQFVGTSKTRITSDGDLLVTVSGDELRSKKPTAFQIVDGHKKLVPVRYRTDRHGRFRFNVGHYDRRRPLVIDPVLVYSTFLGGSNFDSGESIAVDGSGNAYIAGTTLSYDFPTSGAL